MESMEEFGMKRTRAEFRRNNLARSLELLVAVFFGKTNTERGNGES
jgi:hypothetical protein